MSEELENDLSSEFGDLGVDIEGNLVLLERCEFYFVHSSSLFITNFYLIVLLRDFKCSKIKQPYMKDFFLNLRRTYAEK